MIGVKISKHIPFLRHFKPNLIQTIQNMQNTQTTNLG